MFTRFRTASAVQVFNLPLVGLPPQVPGAMFLAALGGAYENEEEHLRSRLLQFATDLSVGLKQPDLMAWPGMQAFQAGLRSVIEFLQKSDENSVYLYSYDRTPSMGDLLDAFATGGGANDWALEELGKKGEKGRKMLLSALKKAEDQETILSAISMLLILFRDDQTIAAVQKFIDNCNADVGREASLLLNAYKSV